METPKRKPSTNRGPLIIAATVAALLLAAAMFGGQAAFARNPGQASTGAGQASKQAAQNKPSQPMVPVGSAFTYQGQLIQDGVPGNGQYDFQFRLYDAPTGGNQVGGAIDMADQTVTNGLFTVSLDFGEAIMQGDARWLEMDARVAGGGSYTTLSPRGALNAVPYSQSLMPGSSTTGSLGGPVLQVTNTGSGDGIRGYTSGTNTAGVYGTSSGTGYGVHGHSTTTYAGVYGDSTAVNGTGVIGLATATNGKGVVGSSTEEDGIGVYGVSNNGFVTLYGIGVRGASNSYYGAGVRGDNAIGAGVYGSSTSSYGVFGHSNTNTGVYGESTGGGNGVYGLSIGGAYSTGVQGVADGANAKAVSGTALNGGWAGFFDGNVRITGTCCAAGAGTFQIDHPLDPANKYLNQTAMESPDMVNVYSGNITTGVNGEAVVTLPSYVEALNKEFRYQLTVMGSQFAQAIVASKIKNNSFTIKTDRPNVEVSWQVTGIRKDPYAQAHPLQAEVDKSANEKGKYLHPELYGQPESKGIDYERKQKLNEQLAKLNTQKTSPEGFRQSRTPGVTK